jgi:large conductance mechanosensitive channel
MWKGFRDFLLRGNVVDLAVAVVIGTAFTAVVDGFTASFVDPLIALILGGVGGVDDLAGIIVGPFPIGLFISAVINFILKAAVIYFFVVRPFAGIAAKFAAAAAPTEDVVLLREIRDLLKQQGTPR